LAETFVQRAKQQLAGSQAELSHKTTRREKNIEQSARIQPEDSTFDSILE